MENNRLDMTSTESFNTINDTTPVTVTFSEGSILWANSSSGGKNPSWRAHIRHGLNATTVFDAEKIIFEGTGEGLVRTDYSNVVTATGQRRANTFEEKSGTVCTVSAPTSPSSIDINAADTLARIEFLQRVRKIQTGLNSGVLLAEIAETIRMIRRPASSLRRGIDDYYGAAKERTRRVNDPGRKRKVLSDTWLEYSFGWKPLIGDIDSAAKRLAEPRHLIDRHYVTGAGRSQSFAKGGFITDTIAFGGGAGTYRYSRATTDTASVLYKGGVRLFDERPQREYRAWGLDSSNFIPTLWEVIPYSFLVDYFTNIGQLIDSATVGHFHHSWGARMTRREKTISIVGLSNLSSNSGGTITSTVIGRVATCPGYKCTRTMLHRDKTGLVSVGLRDFQFRVPGVEQPWKWLNIGALAAKRSVLK